ncbi:MAG: biotin--[acetyl-CoA-carboxylase] ligase [Oscillospiraceae bacterium]|nr:biotin--[acetyl-CoA-carboxylase] ligase [Oscillospiraceae bacterium]
MKQQILNLLPPGHPWKDRIHWFDSLDSTNNRAKLMAREGAPHGTVLIAGHQTGGRGRMGRFFHSPAGKGLYLSVLLRPTAPPEQWMHLTCATAVAACQAMENACGLRPGIKWTNDLVWSRRKLGGILTELVTLPGSTAAIVGIGINLSQNAEDFPPELRSMAGSLAMFCQSLPSREKLAAMLIQQLQQMDRDLLTEKASTLDIYRKNCITLDTDVSIVQGESVRHGHALTVDDRGALVVSFPDGHTEAVNSGEVSIRGMYGYV